MSRAFGPLDTPPPLLAVIGNTRAATLPQLSRENDRDEPPSSGPSSIKMVIIIISSAIIFFASLHLLLRYLSRRCHRSENGGSVSSSSRINGDTLHRNRSFQQQILADDPIKSLPFFSFSSVRRDNFTGGDCAVCLSKFESNDQLRLLPLCCHVFHVECIDTWLSSRETCPLCRSTVYPTEAEVRTKTLSSQDRGNSFRIEIGSLSRRQRSSSESDPNEGMRSYPIGSYEYIVEDSYEVSVGRPSVPGSDKDVVGGVPTSLTSSERVPELPGEGGLVAERSWLMDYVDRLNSFSSSRMFSLRRSGRFFNGSLRRSEGVTSGGDLEANRVGEEISEIFGWLSRV